MRHQENVRFRVKAALAVHVTKQPKHYDENDDRRDYSTAEFPRYEPGKASASGTFHKIAPLL
jgi:hypothetical protein